MRKWSNTYYENNHDIALAKQHEYYNTHKKERALYYQENSEKRTDYQHKYYQENREKIAKQKKIKRQEKQQKKQDFKDKMLCLLKGGSNE